MPNSPKDALAATEEAFASLKETHDVIMAGSYLLGTLLYRDTKQFSEPQLTDIGFLYREMENFCDALRRDVLKKKEQVGRLLAGMIAERVLEGRGVDRADGKYAAAFPKVKVTAQLPPKDSKEYKHLLTQLGIPQEVQKEKLLDISWKRLSEWLTRLEAEGKPLPEHFKLTKREPYVTYRRKTNK